MIAMQVVRASHTQTSASRQRAVKVSSVNPKSTTTTTITPTPTHVAWMKKHIGASTLFAGVAAAQVFLAGPSLAADVFNLPFPAMEPVGDVTTTTTTSVFFADNPVIDTLASLDAADVLTEIEDAEIPQLEVKLGQLAAAAATNPSSSEAVAAAERQLEAIEREAAMIAEAQSSSSSDVATTTSTGGLLNELSALKAVMRGLGGGNGGFE